MFVCLHASIWWLIWVLSVCLAGWWWYNVSSEWWWWCVAGLWDSGQSDGCAEWGLRWRLRVWVRLPTGYGPLVGLARQLPPPLDRLARRLTVLRRHCVLWSYAPQVTHRCYTGIISCKFILLYYNIYFIYLYNNMHTVGNMM